MFFSSEEDDVDKKAYAYIYFKSISSLLAAEDQSDWKHMKFDMKESLTDQYSLYVKRYVYLKM